MVDWWTEVGLATASFLDRHGMLAAFVFLLIEEAGVPVPVPGDVLMLVLGIQSRVRGLDYLVQAIAATWAGTLIGSTLLYFVSRRAGRNLVYRYGRFIRLTPERLDSTEQWLKRHGWGAVFVGRLVPGLRILTAVACGVFEVPFRAFFAAMSLGSLVYILIYTLLGYYLGPPVLDLLEKIHIPFGLLGSLVPLALILLWTYRTRQQALGRRAAAASASGFGEAEWRAGAIAGLLATVGSTLLMNSLINLAGGIAFTAPGTMVEQTAARLAFALASQLQPLVLFIAVPAYLGVGVVWGSIYGMWVEPRLSVDWPDWLKGLAFAGLPFLVSVVFLLPLLGLGLFGVGATGPVAFTGELIRHATYGAMLGWMYPIFRSRRQIKVRPHTAADVPAERPISA